MSTSEYISPFAKRTARIFNKAVGLCEEDHLNIAAWIHHSLIEHRCFLMRLLHMLKREGNLNPERSDWITALEYQVIDLTSSQTSPFFEPYDGGGWVYFIKCEQFTKIGHSINVEARLKSLQTASPFTLKLIKKIRVPDPEQAEARLHEYFAHRRRGGEWFELTEQDMADVQLFESIDLQDLERDDLIVDAVDIPSINVTLEGVQ